MNGRFALLMVVLLPVGCGEQSGPKSELQLQREAAAAAMHNRQATPAKQPDRVRLKGRIRELGGRYTSHTERINVSRTEVTDEDLVWMQPLFGRLEGFSARETQLTSAALEQMESMESLRSLVLAETQITDDSLESLTRLPDLRELNISGTQITDAGLAALAPMTKMRILDLSGTQITDDGLKSLNGMGILMRLDLTGTGVSDAGLEHLQGLIGLRFLFVSADQVSEQATGKLNEQLPACLIERR